MLLIYYMLINMQPFLIFNLLVLRIRHPFLMSQLLNLILIFRDLL